MRKEIGRENIKGEGNKEEEMTPEEWEKKEVIKDIFDYLKEHETVAREELEQAREEGVSRDREDKLIAKAEHIKYLREKFQRGILHSELIEMIKITPFFDEMWAQKRKEEREAEYKKLWDQLFEYEKRRVMLERLMIPGEIRYDKEAREQRRKEVGELKFRKEECEKKLEEYFWSIQGDTRRINDLADVRKFWLEVLPKVSSEDIRKVFGFESKEEIRERKKREKEEKKGKREK